MFFLILLDAYPTLNLRWGLVSGKMKLPAPAAFFGKAKKVVETV
jgi:hypothetical protein